MSWGTELWVSLVYSLLSLAISLSSSISCFSLFPPRRRDRRIRSSLSLPLSPPSRAQAAGAPFDSSRSVCTSRRRRRCTARMYPTRILARRRSCLRHACATNVRPSVRSSIYLSIYLSIRPAAIPPWSSTRSPRTGNVIRDRSKRKRRDADSWTVRVSHRRVSSRACLGICSIRRRPCSFGRRAA